MPCWYYEKKDLRNTPSFQNGVDPDAEARYRREGARFIINTGTKMGLRYDTMATGVVYFHRFYMFHSFKDFPRYVTACCCLFLAGKVEETPKKCKDIIKTARTLLNDHQFAQFGDDPKEEVMTLERILLQTIKFDLQVDHPYGYLLKYAKCLKGDKQKLQKMVQMAWTFVNDSLCTSLCLQWEPEIIAIALMYLAGKLSKFEVVDWTGRQPKHLRWWDMYVEDMSMELLEDICHQVLDLYSSNPGGIRGDSPMATSPSQVQVPGRTPQVPNLPSPSPVPQQMQTIAPPVVVKPRTCAQSGLPHAVSPARFTCGYSMVKTPPPPQPAPSAIPVQVSKTVAQEPPPMPAKPIQVVEHKPPVVQSVPKQIHPTVQSIPVVSEPIVSHPAPQPPLPTTPIPMNQPSNYSYPPPPPTESYTQFSSPVPPPPTYQPPPSFPPPSYPPPETNTQPQPPPPFDSSAPPPNQYTQPPPQHFPPGFEAQNFPSFQPSSQQYFPSQSAYRQPPPPAPQFQENYNNPPPSQYAPAAAPAPAFPTAGGHPPGFPPQTPPFPPIPSSFPPRTAPPPHSHPPPHQPPPQHPPPQHPPPNPTGNIAPVRITGRNNRQSWAM